MIHYVYKLTFKLDPRYYYFGKHSTKNVNDKYMGSGNEIRRYRKLYGKDCFTKQIIGYYDSAAEVMIAEKEIIGDLWKTDPFCLNRVPGGQRDGKFDFTGFIVIHKGDKMRRIEPDKLQVFIDEGWSRGMPQATIEKNRRSSLLMSDERRQQISSSVKKLWEDPTYRANMSEKHKGYQNLKGFQFSQESREKMSKSHKGKWCWMTNGHETLQVPVNEAQNYINRGYINGKQLFSKWRKYRKNILTK